LQPLCQPGRKNAPAAPEARLLNANCHLFQRFAWIDKRPRERLAETRRRRHTRKRRRWRSRALPAGNAIPPPSARGYHSVTAPSLNRRRRPERRFRLAQEESMGYRLRMTMAFALLSVAAVVIFTLLFLSSSYREFKADRMVSMERMTSCLAGNLYWDMQAGDVRRVDEAVGRFSRGVPAPIPPVVVVLDAAGGIFASAGSHERSPTAPAGADDSGADALASGLSLIAAGLQTEGNEATTVESTAGFISVARVARDGERLGTVFVDYPLSSLDRHFVALFRTAVGYSLLLLPLLLAVGWLLGRQLTRPIDRLRTCMQRVGTGDLDIDCRGIRSNDEIGALARGFEEMIEGLREKRLMEKEMMQTERLVSVGQVAAGVAHEINNPLGGMLNAINTFKRHGNDPRVVEKTMDLLERGLQQIRTTVSALLVQSRVESHPLAPADLQDLHTLISAEVRKKGLLLDWQSGLDSRVPLPSSSVRQILMNLLLNAIQAAPEGGRVAMRCEPAGAHLVLRVEDDGPGIDPDNVQRLFEPFFSGTGGHGLGLWVTYQSIGQLGGSIDVTPRLEGDVPRGTVMEVRLPYQRPEPARAAEPAKDAAAAGAGEAVS
jgi:signal transduction histidine kinase